MAIELTINKDLRITDRETYKQPIDKQEIIRKMVEELLRDPEKLKEHRFVPSDFVNEHWMPDLQ